MFENENLDLKMLAKGGSWEMLVKSRGWELLAKSKGWEISRFPNLRFLIFFVADCLLTAMWLMEPRAPFWLHIILGGFVQFDVDP